MNKEFIVVPEAFNSLECDDIASLGDRLALRDATVGTNREVYRDIRSSKIGWMARLHTPSWIFERMDQVVYLINAQYFDVDYRRDGCASFQYTLYEGDENGHYDHHKDTFLPSPFPEHRKLSIVVQLSDPNNYEGGHFEFRDVGEPLPAEAFYRGSAIIFPSILHHAVHPVTNGERRSLVGWYSGPAWR